MIAPDAARLSLDLATPAAVPAIVPPVLPPTPADGRADARVLRRLRRIVRRRVRFEIATLDGTAVTVSDGNLVITLETVSSRDPRVLAWRADRIVALVVLHDGCGARVLGSGGLHGRIELPSALCPRAFLAFCHDVEADAAGG